MQYHPGHILIIYIASWMHCLSNCVYILQVHMEHLQLQKEMAMMRQRENGLADFDVKREASLRDQLMASSKRLSNVEEILAQYVS